MLAGNGYDNSWRRGLQHRCGSDLRHTESGSFDIIAVKELPVKHHADDTCNRIRHREGQPEPIKADARERIPQRHEQHDRADDSQCGAFHARADRLEKHRERQRRHQRQEAYADDAEGNAPDINDRLIRAERAEHLGRDKLKAQRSQSHERHSEAYGGPKRLFAAINVARGIVEAYDRHDAGLHGAQGDEEKALPLVVKAENRHRLVGKRRQNKIKSKYVKRIRRLHQNIRRTEAEYLADVVRIYRPFGRSAETLFHDGQRRDYLPGNCCGGSAGNAHFRQTEHAENKQRIQYNIGDRAGYLCDHRRFHVAACLQHLCPDALEEKSEAENADYPAVNDNIGDYRRVIGGHFCKRRHGAPRYRGKQKPQKNGQRSSHAGVFVGLFTFADAKLCGHDGVYAHARAHGKRDHQKLDRIDDRQCGQARSGIPADKQAVNNVVQRLNKLREHNRRRKPE